MRGPLIAALMLLLAAVTACATPPVVQPAGKRDLTARGMPPGTRVVETRTDDGVALRGLFVPAGEGAPVVLHLLPSATSITTGIELGGMTLSIEKAPRELRDAGLASLILDYRGVGASDGNRDPRALPRDALAMWRMARELAGSPGNVIVRAESIGAIAAAVLLDATEPPAGVILIAPVRAETVGKHGARARGFWGSVTSVFMGSAAAVDLNAAVGRTPAPLLVLLPEHDGYLPADEQAVLERAAQRAGNRVFYLTGDHHDVIERARGLLSAERVFVREIFGGTVRGSIGQ